jgi:5-methylcytosine-specific restriction endonuclease McrA
MSVCPTCSKEFDTDRGVGVHHYSAHGEKIDADEYTEECPSCDDSFKTKQGMRLHHKEVHNESISGEIVKCSWCDSKKREPQYKVEDCDTFFCDKECQSKWMKENRNSEDNPAYKDTSNICKWCNEKYHVKKSVQKTSNFCSKECSSSWKSENIRGDEHPRWQGGYKEYYGWSWDKRREDIQKRDSNNCQNCGLNSQETLDVHHIVPVRTFDNPNNAHFDENMYQLCDECHKKFEKMDAIKQKKILEGIEKEPS